MKITNSDIAELFNRLANLLEIDNANPFRVRAYRNAARVIANQSKPLFELVQNNTDLSQLPFIGKDLANKIKLIIKTGNLPDLVAAEKRMPPTLTELLQLEGLGPKRVRALYEHLQVRSIADLNKVLENGKFRSLSGFSEKLEKKIKASIQHAALYQQRILLADAIGIADRYCQYLQYCPDIKKVAVAGSYRRRKETVGDLDIVVVGEKHEKIIDYFVQFDEVSEVISRGSTRSTIRLRSGLHVDLQIISQNSYGAALLYFTGSRGHTIKLRTIALQNGLKINQEGVFKNNTCIASQTELQMYQALGMTYIEPELREEHGEIEAALQHQLPSLITLADIKGDCHCHTDSTDGTATLDMMVKAAIARGYEYIAITDHSQHLTIANGLNQKRLFQQLAKIDLFNEQYDNFVILKALECDILEDGSLDLPNKILKQLDLTVCSIHSHFNLSRKKQTERILRAMDNPYFTILAHPTNRLIGKRKACELNMEIILQAAKEKNCILEINSQPRRCDLNDIYCKIAKEMQVKLIISSDAHGVKQMDNMQFGISQARRGWLSAKDVLNTYSLASFKKLLIRS